MLTIYTRLTALAAVFLLGVPAALASEPGESTEPTPDRYLDPGFAARLGAFVPIGDSHGTVSGGLLFDASFILESQDWSIEFRSGVRTDLGFDVDHGFLKVPFDIAANYIIDTGNIAPFIGGGVGLALVFDRRPISTPSGVVIQTVATNTDWELEAGANLFARAGVIFRRDSFLRLFLMAEFEATILEINGFSNPHAFNIGFGIIL